MTINITPDWEKCVMTDYPEGYIQTKKDIIKMLTEKEFPIPQAVRLLREVEEEILLFTNVNPRL